MLSFLRRYFIDKFFAPDQTDFGPPSMQNISYEDLSFKTPSGRMLHGYFLSSHQKPKGTIIQCHGNDGNITASYPSVVFLVQSGYHVFCFDYAGYGQSQGNPSPDSIIEDTRAAVEYVRGRPDVDSSKLGLFGQSLGGVPASAVMAQDPNIRLLILEATFTTYRQMAFATTLGKILFFLTPFVIPDRGPLYQVPQISPRPILFIHGNADGKVPVRFSYQLYDAAKDKKSLLILHGYHHLKGTEGFPEYENTILQFIQKSLLK